MYCSAVGSFSHQTRCFKHLDTSFSFSTVFCDSLFRECLQFIFVFGQVQECDTEHTTSKSFVAQVKHYFCSQVKAVNSICEHQHCSVRMDLTLRKQLLLEIVQCLGSVRKESCHSSQILTLVRSYNGSL